MASRPDLPTSYDECRELWYGPGRHRKGGNGKRLCYQTWLLPVEDGFAIVHHRTAIVTFHPDGSATLTTGKWYSATTKQRLNAALFGSPWGIYAERGEWFWYHRDCPGQPAFLFEDGDRVFLGAGRRSVVVGGA